jgi:hypothetical protein
MLILLPKQSRVINLLHPATAARIKKTPEPQIILYNIGYITIFKKELNSKFPFSIDSKMAKIEFPTCQPKKSSEDHKN